MKYFTISELCDSSTARAKGIDNRPSASATDHLIELVEKALDPIREEWGGAIKINSAYRCQNLNILVGGSKTSSHVMGYAADIVPANGNMAAFQKLVLAWAKRNTFDQIIIEYPTNNIAKWIHIGIRNASGLQRKQILYTLNGRQYLPVTQAYYLK